MAKVRDEQPPGVASEDARKLRRLLAGHVFTQILGTAVRLGIFDQLTRGSRSVEELSAAAGARVSEMGRFLRALEGLEVIKHDADTYEISAMGRLLTRDEGALYGHAVLSSTDYYEAWGRLGDALSSGESAYEKQFGCGMWERLSQRAELADCFARMMRQNTDTVGTRLARLGAVPARGLVADLGAGQGSLLIELLTALPDLRGIALEQGSMLLPMSTAISEAGLTDRCEVLAGNLLEAVPQGADVYVLKSVLHNWKDDDAIRILQNCRSSMGRGARLLVLERVVPALASGNELLNVAILDLSMLVLFGASDRSVDDYGALLTSAGLSVERSLDLGSNLVVIESSSADQSCTS
jgi:hypothetical protein